ncbi:hypothetical protein AU194_21875 [Mycobacterium sp. GA-2829]|nr:hypothetical protein AU194_21875 [Mycobacterium sp. GA-2829]
MDLDAPTSSGSCCTQPADEYRLENTIMPRHPDPAQLPPNTVCEDGWQDDEGRPYRIFSGRDRRVSGVEGVIGTSAVQYSDGTIEASQDDGPHIWLGIAVNEAINSSQARQLAALLLETADEVDQWVEAPSSGALHEFTCMACRAEAEDVSCPICQAQPYQPCADADGEPRSGGSHASRLTAAQEARR